MLWVLIRIALARLGEEILSTNNIGFYEEKMRISFLAHLSRRLIGELIVYPLSGVRRRPSVVHNAQTSSSQKQLGRSKPNFMWSLLG